MRRGAVMGAMRLTTGTILTAAVVSLLAAPAAAAVRARLVAGPLDAPTAFTFGPGNVAWYVEKSTGEIRMYDLDTDEDTLFATVPGVDADGERGMLGIALHPRYPETPFVYVYATRSVEGRLRNQIVRYTDDGGSGTARRVIWSSPASSSPYHNGGRILFGPDRMLYAVVGDGHDPANAQDRTRNDRGKVLRMTPRGGVPADNPFRDSRILAYGIRNSFGLAFDPRTGHLWESENGPQCNDELNRIREGRNYGWGPNETCEGRSPRNTNQDGPRPVMPELWWTPTIAPTGVAFCERCGLGTKSRGRLFLADYVAGRLRRITLNAERSAVRGQRVVFDHDAGILSLEVGPGGDLYFSGFDGIYLLERSRPAA